MLCHLSPPQVQHDEMEKQRMHMIHQQMAAGSMVSTEPTASAAMTYQPPVVGIMAGAGVTPMALSMPSTLQQSTTLAGALGQSAQSLLQHSLSGSLSSHAAATASTAVFGPSSCPELPQVCAAARLHCAGLPQLTPTLRQQPYSLRLRIEPSADTEADRRAQRRRTLHCSSSRHAWPAGQQQLQHFQSLALRSLCVLGP